MWCDQRKVAELCVLSPVSDLIPQSYPCYSPLLDRSPRIMATQLSEKCKTIRIGCPIVLQCEVSDSAAQVSWFKDEMELFCKTGLDMKRDGNLRKLMIHSAKLSDSGLYSCSLGDDAVTFHVDVEGDFAILTFKQKHFSLNSVNFDKLSIHKLTIDQVD